MIRKLAKFLNLRPLLIWGFIITCLIYGLIAPPVGRAEPTSRFFTVRGLPVLMLWGPPHAAGRIHGERFRPQIQRLIHQVLEKKFLGPHPQKIKAEMLRYLKGGLARLPARLRAELQGLAQGAEVSLEDIYLLNFYAETTLYPACSLLGVLGSRSAGRHLLVGRNLDWPHLEGTPIILLAYGAPGTIPFAALTLPGIPFPTLGLNQAGLCLAPNTSFSREPLPRNGQFILPLLRQALAETETLSRAVRLITRPPRFHAWNVLLASARQRRMRCLELGHRHWSSRRPRYGLLISTNHLLSPALRPIAQPADDSSIRRNSRLIHLASEKPRLTVADLEEILLDPQIWEDTVYSAVCDLNTLRLSVCPSHSRTYIPVDLGKILRSFPRRHR